MGTHIWYGYSIKMGTQFILGTQFKFEYSHQCNIKDKCAVDYISLHLSIQVTTLEGICYKWLNTESDYPNRPDTLVSCSVGLVFPWMNTFKLNRIPNTTCFIVKSGYPTHNGYPFHIWVLTSLQYKGELCSRLYQSAPINSSDNIGENLLQVVIHWKWVPK